MKRLKAGIALLLALALLATGAAGLAEAVEEAPVLTLMVYITGSDLESLGGAATGDITEMLHSGVDTEKVNVILCAGGSKLWQIGFPNDAVSVYRLDRRRLRPLTTLGKVSMGAPETLTAFMNYAAENYPAERYALILWDHGGGPMNGVCFDELFTQGKGHDSLDLNELRAALEASPFSQARPLEWIGFDACLMSSVETAYACAPYARYMVASQETEPGTGWDYGFLRGAGEDLSGEAIGERIIASYGAAGDAPGLMLTLSCVDLSAIGEVEAAMDGLFSSLDGMLGPDRFSEISNARRDAKSFGRASTGSEYDLVDLYSLSEQYAQVQPERVAAVQAALDRAVVRNFGNQPNSHGLSVYYPYYNKDYFANGWKQLYGTWGFARQYYGFLLDYADVWLGEQMADWSNIRATAEEANATAQELTLPLTPEQVANFAFAQVFILGKMPFMNWYFYKVDEIDEVTLDEDGVLHADYNYKALYPVNADGEPLCDAVPYRIVDGYYLIRANLTDKTYEEYWDELFAGRGVGVNEDATMEARKVYLQCLPNEAGDGLDVVGIIDMRDELGEGTYGLLVEGEGMFTGKQILSADLEGWNYVWFFHFPRELASDGAGGLQSFEDWPDPNDGERFTVSWEEIDNAQPWSLKFLEHQYTGRDLYAQYIVHDTQGNLTGSNLLPVANPNLERVLDEPRVLADTDNFTLTLTGVDLARATFNDGLFLRLKMEDKRAVKTPFDMYAQDVVLNRFRLDDDYTPVSAMDAAGNVTYVLNLPSKDMPTALEERLEHIAFKLRVYENEGSFDDIEYLPVSLDVDIDMSGVHAYTAQGEPLAEARAGDTLYRLLDIEDRGEYLALQIYAENLGDEDKDKTWSGTAMVDSCAWHSAVEGAWFEIPANSGALEEVKLYKTSPDVDSIDNWDGIPPYSYPVYWNTPVIHRLEFTDWDEGVVCFELAEPYALSGMEGVSGGEAPPEFVTLLSTDEIEVRLSSFGARDGELRPSVDISNRTDAELDFMAQGAEIDGAAADARLCDMDGLTSSLFGNVTIPAGSRMRYICAIKSKADEATETGEAGVESFGMRFQYRPQDGEWRFATQAELRFKGGRQAPEALGKLRLADVEAVALCEPLENEPVDPTSLFDVTFDLPQAASAYAVTLRAPLTEAQQAEFASAEAKLVWRRPKAEPETYGLQYVAELYAPVTLEDGALACDFSGLLLRCGDCEVPPCQHIIPNRNGGAVYSLRGMSVYTDNADSYSRDVLAERVDVTLDADGQSARIDRVKLERDIGSAERLSLLEYMSLLYDYADGEGSELEYSGSLAGSSCEVDGETAPLVVRPVGDIDLWVVFTVKNRDGGAYTVALPYGDSAAPVS